MGVFRGGGKGVSPRQLPPLPRVLKEVKKKDEIKIRKEGKISKNVKPLPKLKHFCNLGGG